MGGPCLEGVLQDGPCNRNDRKPNIRCRSSPGSGSARARLELSGARNIFPSKGVLQAAASDNNKSRPIARIHCRAAAPRPCFGDIRRPPLILCRGFVPQLPGRGPVPGRISPSPSQGIARENCTKLPSRNDYATFMKTFPSSQRRMPGASPREEQARAKRKHDSAQPQEWGEASMLDFAGLTTPERRATPPLRGGE